MSEKTPVPPKAVEKPAPKKPGRVKKFFKGVADTLGEALGEYLFGGGR